MLFFIFGNMWNISKLAPQNKPLCSRGLYRRSVQNPICILKYLSPRPQNLAKLGNPLIIISWPGSPSDGGDGGGVPTTLESGASPGPWWPGTKYPVWGIPHFDIQRLSLSTVRTSLHRFFTMPLEPCAERMSEVLVCDEIACSGWVAE